MRKPKNTLKQAISIGVVEYKQCYKSIEQLIMAADQAMYEVKEKGRNNVVKKTGD